MTAGVKRAAGAVVVAHLDRALRSRPRPDQSSAVSDRLRCVAGLVAEQARSSIFGGSHDLAGIEAGPAGSKRSLTSSKARTIRGPNMGLVELGAHQPVAVLARMRALVLAHHVEGLLGDGPHRLDVPRA